MAWTSSQPGALAIPRDRKGETIRLFRSEPGNTALLLLPYSIGHTAQILGRDNPPLDRNSMEKLGGHVL